MLLKKKANMPAPINNMTVTHFTRMKNSVFMKATDTVYTHIRDACITYMYVLHMYYLDMEGR